MASELLKPPTIDSGEGKGAGRWALGAAVLSALLSIPLLADDFTYDQSVFAVMADGMLRGDVAYRDLWELKPPGIHIVYYVAFLLLGRNLWGIRVLEIAAVALSAAGLVRYTQRRWGSTTPGLVAALTLPILYHLFQGSSAEPESFQIPFLVWAMVVWPLESEESTRLQRCCLAGLLLSIAFIFKITIVFFPLAFMVERIWIDGRRPGGWDRLAPSVSLAFGLLGAPALVAAYYGARGALEPLLDATFYFPYHYSSLEPGFKVTHPLRMAVQWMEWLLSIPAVLLILLGFVRGMILRRKETVRWACGLLLAWTLMWIQGKYFSYHHLILLPFVALGFGLPFLSSAESGRLDWPHRLSVHRGVTLLSLGLLSAALLFAVSAGWDAWRGFGEIARVDRPGRTVPALAMREPSEQVARLIRERTQAQDRVFVWGEEPWIYFRSERPAAGPYFHLIQMVPPWEPTRRLYTQLESLFRLKPGVIVLLCTEREVWWRNASPPALLKQYPDLVEFIRDNYHLEQTISPYEVWFRNELSKASR